MIHWKAWLVLGLVFLLPFWVVIRSDGQARQPFTSDLADYPWVYLRDNRSIAKGEKVIEGIFTGDIICGREGKSLDFDLESVALWLRAADFVMGNLECVVGYVNDSLISSTQNDEPGPILLFAHPQSIEVLREAGFDILGIANNHSFDLGEAGLHGTVQNLRRFGIQVAGVCAQQACRDGIIIKETAGLRIAIVAINAISSPDILDRLSKKNLFVVGWDSSQSLLSLIQLLRAEVHAVVVSIHWGKEYELEASPAQRRIAAQLLSAGADLVVGHHPHVVQGLDVLPAPNNSELGIVAYSLGNLIADQQFGETIDGLVLRSYFDQHGLRAMQALPIRVGLAPSLLKMDHSMSLFNRIMPEDRQRAFSCDQDTCQENPASVASERSINGLFWSGEADLTGDGIPEKVQRQAGQVVVFADGMETWRTPAAWDVVDLALGDPDSDGRQEMLMAFWRADDSGIQRSHPFIVGYRGGTYHETWGGSGVSDPILEVELGDIDGDGMEELAVLEQRTSQKIAITVWDWHGWGFSLKWRSKDGEYQNLRIIQNPQIGKAILVVDEHSLFWEAKD